MQRAAALIPSTPQGLLQGEPATGSKLWHAQGNEVYTKQTGVPSRETINNVLCRHFSPNGSGRHSCCYAVRCMPHR